MKTFLQHDDSGLFYGEGNWVADLSNARSFGSIEEAEVFRVSSRLAPAHPVGRLDPSLIARFYTRAPGQYQVGE
jgi:hypothetical protein